MEKIIETLQKFEKIIVVWGGTGGHISPIISIFKRWKKQNFSEKILWIGGKNSEEEREAKRNCVDFRGISVLKLSTTKSPKIALYPFAFIKTFFEALKILQKEQKKHKNLCLFSKGGPGALAIGMAAKFLKIPIFIHESDTIPGRSNLKMWFFSEKIFLGFDSTKKFFKNKNCEIVGQILDDEIFEKNPHATIAWKTKKPHILVFCGSQGAKSVFEEIIKNCQNLDVEWMIILGKLNTNMRQDFENFAHIQIFDWLDKKNQNSVFSDTNLAITRWSATTLAELEHFQIKKIIIPLPSAAKNHQFFNAKEYEKNDDILLEQKNISKLYEILKKNLNKNP